jgi:hypothetical protein
MSISFETAERIRLKKAQYCRFVDTKQWESFRRLALPHAKFIFYGVDGKILHEFSSTEDLLVPTVRLLEGARTSHRVCNSELSWVSERKVCAIWAMEDYLVFPAQNGNPGSAMRGYGHYYETWEKHGDDWFLAKLELHRQILSSFVLRSGDALTDADGRS